MGATAPIFLSLYKITSMTIEEYTYQDFLAYLLLLGAQADLNISEEEKEDIVQKVGEIEYKKVNKL